MRLVRTVFALTSLVVLGAGLGGCGVTINANANAGLRLAAVPQFSREFGGVRHLRPGDPCPDKPGTVIPNGRGGLTCDCIPRRRPMMFNPGVAWGGSPAYGFRR